MNTDIPVSPTLAGWKIELDASRIVTAALDLPGKINIMDDRFTDAMEALLAYLGQTPDLRGLILTSAKSVFLAGGDLKRMAQAQATEKKDLVTYFTQLKGYLRSLETLGMPTVAVINGAALGGGYETCLACHYRIGVDTPGVRVGLPEIEFGILAGAGGVVRATRLLGFEAVQPYLLEGKVEDASGALSAGLIDALATDQAHAIALARAWIEAHPQARQRWDARDETAHARRAYAALPDLLKPLETREDAYAAERNLMLAAESLNLDFDDALRHETDVLIDLLVTDYAQAKMNAFLSARTPRAPAGQATERVQA